MIYMDIPEIKQAILSDSRLTPEGKESIGDRDFIDNLVSQVQRGMPIEEAVTMANEI